MNKRFLKHLLMTLLVMCTLFIAVVSIFLIPFFGFLVSISIILNHALSIGIAIIIFSILCLIFSYLSL